jgi:hypothetical protein
LPEIDIGPQLKADDEVRFLDSHRPALDDGTYTVNVTHHLEVKGKTELDAQRSLTFVVAGPRFVLAPGEVASCFPPPGARGAFGAVLPHVLLRRASLPWERSATPDGNRNGPPWLALLVLDESEILKSATVRASELMTAAIAATVPAPGPTFATLPRGAGDDPHQQVHVIELAADVAANILPDVGELSFLTGVRDVNGVDSRALVVANRLPAKDKRNHVHLVSLEQQYRPAPPSPTGPTHAHWASGLSTGTVRFVSLASWEFFCEGSGGDLGTILEERVAIRRLALNAARLGTSAGPVQAGAVPVEYRLATGERTAAWYHGPLALRDHGTLAGLPARHAADLLLVERATGMADISYAAAWELGRMLALRDPAVGVRLHQWKRQVAHADRAAEWLDRVPEAMPASPNAPVFTLGDWFENALGRLKAVPFSYLVPEPALLPEESLCLFTLDRQWIAALFDGAFSIGRNSAARQKIDGALRKVLPAIPSRSGILLRSAAVAGWPDLVVDAFARGGTPLDPVRFERLAKDTLLVLFEGVVERVEVHPHPQAQHFGFDGDAASGFTKRGHVVPLRKTDPQVVAIGDLARALGASGSHEFAAAMIEGVPKVSYSVVKMQVSHV